MKDQITQGEWRVIKHEGKYYIKAGSNPDMIVELVKNFNNDEANAEAICKAVNNTYAKGRDPEKLDKYFELFTETFIFLQRLRGENQFFNSAIELEHGCNGEEIEDELKSLIERILKSEDK